MLLHQGVFYFVIAVSFLKPNHACDQQQTWAHPVLGFVVVSLCHFSLSLCTVCIGNGLISNGLYSNSMISNDFQYTKRVPSIPFNAKHRTFQTH